MPEITLNPNMQVGLEEIIVRALSPGSMTALMEPLDEVTRAALAGAFIALKILGVRAIMIDDRAETVPDEALLNTVKPYIDNNFSVVMLAEPARCFYIGEKIGRPMPVQGHG